MTSRGGDETPKIVRHRIDVKLTRDKNSRETVARLPARHGAKHLDGGTLIAELTPSGRYKGQVRLWCEVAGEVIDHAAACGPVHSNSDRRFRRHAVVGGDRTDGLGAAGYQGRSFVVGHSWTARQMSQRNTNHCLGPTAVIWSRTGAPVHPGRWVIRLASFACAGRRVSRVATVCSSVIVRPFMYLEAGVYRRWVGGRGALGKAARVSSRRWTGLSLSIRQTHVGAGVKLPTGSCSVHLP